MMIVSAHGSRPSFALSLISHCFAVLCFGVLVLASASPLFAAQPTPPASADEVNALRAEVAALKELILSLQKKIDGASTAAMETPAAVPPPPASAMTQPIVIAGGGGSKNFLNLSFDLLAAAGVSTTPDIGSIETGGHDPAQRGVTVQNVEMVLEGAVDPYFKGQGNIVFQIDDQGNTNIELEEAYLTSTSLPANLQVKAGQFFTEFGRLNPQHPHTWDFVDQPLVNGRLLGGDGLRGPGARLSWLAPTPFYSEFFLTAQNSQGETAHSFRNVAGEEMFGRTLQDRPVRNAGDMLYSGRYATSFDPSDTQTVVLGGSAAFGPNGSSQRARSELYDVDFFYKWKPAASEAGFPFVKAQMEVMKRRYRADRFSADTQSDGSIDLQLPAETLKDKGAYAQVLFGFRRGWVAGLRGDYVDGNDGAFTGDPARLRHWRISPNITWFPTEFSKFRLQYNHDRVEGVGSDESLWAQMEFILGAHAAHKF